MGRTGAAPTIGTWRAVPGRDVTLARARATSLPRRAIRSVEVLAGTHAEGSPVLRLDEGPGGG